MSDLFGTNGSGTYTTSRGVKVTFNGIATLIDALQSSLNAKKPLPPTYEVKSLAGNSEIHAHDGTTLETEADRAAWSEFQTKLTTWNDESQRSLMRLILLRGISVELPSDTDWEKQQEFAGIAIPQDPMEKRMHYLQTEVLGSVADYQAMVVGVMRVSGVPEDLLDQVEASFRRSLGRDGNKETAVAVEQVESIGTVRASQSRQRTGNTVE